MDDRLKVVLHEDGIKRYSCGPLRKGLKKRKKFFNFKFYKKSFLILFWLSILVGFYIVVLFLQMPSFNSMLAVERKPSIVVLDESGKKIAGINDNYGLITESSDLPPHVWQAIVAIEDKRFFKHRGIDYRGLTRATFVNLFTGKPMQGGSTITQQVAKNIFLSSKRNFNRKIIELILSGMLERKFTKEQILNLYMNRVSLASGKYGLDAAAHEIFNKSLKNLEIWEAASLAGMLKAPTTYSPFRNPEFNIGRTRVVLREMEQQGYITKAEYDREVKRIKFDKKKQVGHASRYFADMVVTEVKSLIGDINEDIVVRTTLDTKMQQYAQDMLNQVLDGSELEGAVVIFDYDGKVKTVVGGRDYQKSQFNRAYQAKRQSGSAFKPFVYLAGFENGMKLTDPVYDEAIEIDGWSPKNYNKRYLGKVSLTYAFAQSINTIPLKITQQVGLRSVVRTAKKMGVVADYRYDMSLVLGSNEISLFDLTVGYIPFANGGYGMTPTLITEIRGDEGIKWSKNSIAKTRLIEKGNYEDMRTLLREVIVNGSGKRAYYPGLLGGKTGTSSENKDAWFIGFDDEYVAGVWVGNDDSAPMSDDVLGGTLPAIVFRMILKK